ncbi:hypothetical protein P152DRAFT_236664 [Eremomyces bilateralis CBS 781.70]|uniref:Uncharacterized protein n=1 Tax=Eremomyces bilateralis CBS 781.70 TaxID=1392243 RepID=A0A6G1GAD8_9PEZI|nr:uncharacterized protein P152DRAFT_236664 [Eremomyces bilateralis CBS 781.70]KAF1814871.1 hypothetical protein P152DRAFT_236664 [Eremomyces bilateralis CBS 781.70]
MATICPDLSAHRKGNREADARLSSAGAAVSLRQAPAHTLPSFPVVGLGNKESSAGAAASLAHANKRSVELWKPNPDASTAGSRAAILAHRDHAGTLRKGKTPVKSEAAKEAVTPRDHGALLAATKAVKMKRQRADSMSVRPVSSSTYPRKDSGPGSGVPGLTSAEEDIERSPALRASRIHNIGTNLPREMYTEHPPVGIEVEEQRHQTALRASAISMAKQMYNAREKASEQASLDVLKATAAEDEKKKGSDSGKARVQQYLNLHDAARKLANERLKRIDDEGEFRAYRTYYSCDDPSLQQRRSTRVGMARRRAASDSSSTSRSVSGARDDMEQSKAIRAQMSQFSNLLAAVDDKKRRQDMERVLVAAQKNVHAQMLHMDEKVYQDTGRIPYATQVEWDREAQALAAERGEKRMEHFGKVEVGFGRFVERDAVDRVARDRVKPTIEDIDDQVEVQKAQEEGRRLDREYEKRHARLEKEREAELKADLKRAKKKSAIGGIGDQAEEQETPEEVRRLDMEYERHHAQLEKERDAELKAELKRLKRKRRDACLKTRGGHQPRLRALLVQTLASRREFHPYGRVRCHMG